MFDCQTTTEVAVGEEGEGGGGVGDGGVSSDFPEWDVVLGDGGEVGFRQIGDEGEREGVIGRGPSLVGVSGGREIGRVGFSGEADHCWVFR